MKQLPFILFLSITFIGTISFGQQLLKGTITDEEGIGIPYAKVFVKNSSDQRTIADRHGHYEMWLYPDEYFLFFSATGFDTREAYVTITTKPVEKHMMLFPTKIQDLKDVQVSVKKSNPGREIILKVIEQRDKISPWAYPHSVHGYTKASEKITRKEEKQNKGKKKKIKTEEPSDPTGIEDPFAEKRKKDKEFANNMNLVEVDFMRHYGSRFKVKEVRNAYDKRGSKYNQLYYTTTVKSNFNFFQNLLLLNDLHETPVSSPISGPGILSYKYRLVDQFESEGQKIHKIKIIARNTATTTLSGHIYVIDSLWLVQKIEFSMEKGNLLIYDDFSIRQEFSHPGDSICVLTKQVLEYGVKYKSERSECKTITKFDSYNFTPNFPSKFFGNEVAITSQEAYDKDSTYWANSRKEELTEEERNFILIKDSIYDAEHRVEYLDSIDQNFNKITALKVLWWGVDHRNRAKKTQWTINSVAGSIRPVYIAGPRVSPGFFYFKKWEDERFIDSYTDISYGFLNSDIKGSTGLDFRYSPFHFGTLSIGFEHNFDVIRGYDAISQIYRRDNFIEVTGLSIGNEYEVFNGMFLETELIFGERRSVKDYKFIESADEFIPNTEPTEFESYQGMLFDLTLRYTPGQKYMREPKRKVILGSKWPTLYLWYEKGIPTILGSDIDHDYIRFGAMQTFNIGNIGKSSYHITTGWFLNTKGLRDADQKFHRRSDPIWFSNPLYSFQGLDSTLPTQKIYFEGHYIHHAKGAILNKIPFMKKTGIGLVFGGGALYIPDLNWQHYEILSGLERNFKLSKARLRIGIYGILSDGNNITPTPGWKISFAVLNNRNLKWNF